MFGLLIFSVSKGYSKIWRVNNIPSVNAHFIQLSTAEASSLVSSGDTLYVEGSPTTYTSLTLNKKLTIIGPGFNLGYNDSTQANPSPARINSVYFKQGAKGSVIIGMYIGLNSSPVTVDADEISILRNKIDFKYRGIEIRNNRKDIIINGNDIYGGNNTSSHYACIYFSSNVFNIIVNNNILKRHHISYYAFYGSTSAGNIIFSHNIINGKVKMYNAVVINNIMVGGSWERSSTYPNSESFNISAGNEFVSGNGNQNNVVMTDVFLNTGSTNGKKYKLKVGSPAIGQGSGGLDIGIFGGSQPFQLSGMPAIPSIFNLVTSSAGSSETGLSVTVKAKSHK